MEAPPDQPVPGATGGAKAVVRIPPARLVSSMAVILLVLPRIGSPERIGPVARGAGLRALAPSSILQLPGYAPAAMRTLADLVRTVPVVELVSDDPRRAAALLRGVLERRDQPPSVA